MLRRTLCSLRRGQPNAPGALDRWTHRIPEAHRPFQGGQQHFQQLLLHRANQVAAREIRRDVGAGMVLPSADAGARGATRGGAAGSVGHGSGSSAAAAAEPTLRFPEQGVLFDRQRRHDDFGAAMQEEQQQDGFVSQRTFNERDFYERVQAEMRVNWKRSNRAAAAAAAAAASSEAAGAGGDESSSSGSGGGGGAASEGKSAGSSASVITSDAEFQASHGFSLLKRTSTLKRNNVSRNSDRLGGGSDIFPQQTSYAALDMWGEAPQYGPGVYFLYLVARRRNAYAIMFDYKGKRLLPAYSVGSRGLKETDKGFRHEGSAENAHQVTSQYLSDVLPRVREAEHAAGRAAGTDHKKKIPVVVRLLGFYNGRQGAVRAVMDHSDAFEVTHVEDVTPFPLNGPRMPRAVVKASD